MHILIANLSSKLPHILQYNGYTFFKELLSKMINHAYLDFSNFKKRSGLFDKEAIFHIKVPSASFYLLLKYCSWENTIQS